MRYVKIDDVKAGMCLAYTIFDEYGHTLICSGSVLSDIYINRLMSLGFDGVYITDELSEDIKIEPAISPELRSEGLICVRENNIDKCKEVASKIVEQLINKNNISLDLTDLRSFDGYTFAHSVNVAVLSCIIGFGLKMSEKDLYQVVIAALLHDMGKILIPTQILNKNGRLTHDEYEIMKSHALLSYDMISERWDISSHTKVAVKYHHENVDGSGYPDGIMGDEMSIYTKILHVADVYDALISKRPYKNPYSPYEACEYLMGACGIMFDAKVVESLLMYVPFYPKGTQVTLSDGREAIIVDNYGPRNLRPLIRLLNGAEIDLLKRQNYNITILHGTNEEVTDPRIFEPERLKMIMNRKRINIMAIDNMSINLSGLKAVLQSVYDIKTFCNPEDALRYIRNKDDIDLIIMELNLPGINGIELIARVNEITGSTIPVMFTLDNYDRDVIYKCRKAGAKGYIVRPYKSTYIKSEINRILSVGSD